MKTTGLELERDPGAAVPASARESRLGPAAPTPEGAGARGRPGPTRWLATRSVLILGLGLAGGALLSDRLPMLLGSSASAADEANVLTVGAGGGQGAGGPHSSVRYSTTDGPTPGGDAKPGTGIAPLTPGAATEDERNTVSIFRAVAPSTVFVTQKREVMDFFTRESQEIDAGSGSGFVWDDKGHIVTNFHVVDGATALTVQLYDGRSLPARVVGTAPRKDIAVIQVDAADLKAIPVLPAEGLIEVGQKTVAIGNPFGLDYTLTTGVVSAVGRELPGAGGVSIREMVQTDAAINPGNSGGPLLNSAGQLIGMNTMIVSPSGQSAGIGFAVPVQTIRRAVPQLIAHGKLVQVGLGIRIDPRGRLERRLGVEGVILLAVPSGSPAAQAGLQGVKEARGRFELGDVIVGIGEETVENYDDLYNALDAYRAGDSVPVHVRGSDNKRRTAKVQVIELK